MQFDGTSATHRHFLALCLSVLSVDARIHCFPGHHLFIEQVAGSKPRKKPRITETNEHFSLPQTPRQLFEERELVAQSPNPEG